MQIKRKMWPRIQRRSMVHAVKRRCSNSSLGSEGIGAGVEGMPAPPWAPTLLPLLLWNHRACLLDRGSPHGGLLQSWSTAHHASWTRVSRSHRTRRSTFGKAFPEGNGSDQRVGISRVKILFILPQCWKRNTAWKTNTSGGVETMDLRVRRDIPMLSASRSSRGLLSFSSRLEHSLFKAWICFCSQTPETKALKCTWAENLHY